MSEYPETSAVNCRVLPSATMVVAFGVRLIVTVAVVIVHVLVELELLLDVLVDVPVDVGVQVLPHPTKENIQTPNSANESARLISDLSWRYRGSGIIKTRLLFWSTTIARLVAGSMATANC
jgi:hypothetical protein